MLAIRSALGLSQAQLAKRAELDRIEILNVEKGRNKASSARIRDGLARGFGLSIEETSAGLDGHLTPEDILNLIGPLAPPMVRKKKRPRRAARPGAARTRSPKALKKAA